MPCPSTLDVDKQCFCRHGEPTTLPPAAAVQSRTRMTRACASPHACGHRRPCRCTAERLAVFSSTCKTHVQKQMDSLLVHRLKPASSTSAVENPAKDRPCREQSRRHHGSSLPGRETRTAGIMESGERPPWPARTGPQGRGIKATSPYHAGLLARRHRRSGHTDKDPGPDKNNEPGIGQQAPSPAGRGSRLCKSCSTRHHILFDQ